MNFKMCTSFYRFKKQQTGAVLLAVLVVALALVILLGVVSQALNNRLNLAQQAKQNLLDAALVYGKLNEISYLLATQRITVAGVSTGVNPQGLLRDEDGHWLLNVVGDEIRTDGFTYTEKNQMEFSIQNEAGLISINSAGQFWLKKTLARYGLSVIEQASFTDILADYADSDDWRRPAGAESYSYEKDKRPMPRNYLLQNCSELWRLQIWSKWLAEHNDWLSFCSLSRSETLNLNSVPIKLWQRLWPSSVTNISNMRLNGKWLVTNNDILAVEPAMALIFDEYIKNVGGQRYYLAIKKEKQTRTIKMQIGEGKKKPLLWQ